MDAIATNYCPSGYHHGLSIVKSVHAIAPNMAASQNELSQVLVRHYSTNADVIILIDADTVHDCLLGSHSTLGPGATVTLTVNRC